MDIGIEQISAQALKSQEQTLATLNRLFDVAQAGKIFSEPMRVGDATVITAAEINVGLGLGFGSGMGEGQAEEEGEGTGPSAGKGGGGGGGGGGASMGRPVAAIIVDRTGVVRVEPIVDVTKIAVVLFTALGAIFVARRGMKQIARG